MIRYILISGRSLYICGMKYSAGKLRERITCCSTACRILSCEQIEGLPKRWADGVKKNSADAELRNSRGL